MVEIVGGLVVFYANSATFLNPIKCTGVNGGVGSGGGSTVSYGGSGGRRNCYMFF